MLQGSHSALRDCHCDVSVTPRDVAQDVQKLYPGRLLLIRVFHQNLDASHHQAVQFETWAADNDGISIWQLSMLADPWR